MITYKEFEVLRAIMKGYVRISLQWYRHSGELVLRGVGAWYRI